MRSKLPRNDRPSAARREIEVLKLIFDQLLERHCNRKTVLPGIKPRPKIMVSR